jgi:hypothetical protein
MNIRPETFAAVTRDVELLKTQVTALLRLIGEQKTPRDATIMGFCRRNHISRSSYLNYRKQGIGPVETRVGGRVIITAEAEEAWHRERQKATPEMLARRQAASDAELAELRRNPPA